VANPENIEGKGFDKHPENIGGGRPKGLKNRATIAKAIFNMKVKYPEEVLVELKKMYPDMTNNITVEQAMAIMQAVKAIQDKDTAAYRALMDSCYGLPKQEISATVGPAKQDIANIFPTQEELDEAKATNK